jgi:hypothetical protein
MYPPQWDDQNQAKADRFWARATAHTGHARTREQEGTPVLLWRLPACPDNASACVHRTWTTSWWDDRVDGNSDRWKKPWQVRQMAPRRPRVPAGVLPSLSHRSHGVTCPAPVRSLFFIRSVIWKSRDMSWTGSLRVRTFLGGSITSRSFCVAAGRFYFLGKNKAWLGSRGCLPSRHMSLLH